MAVNSGEPYTRKSQITHLQHKNLAGVRHVHDELCIGAVSISNQKISRPSLFFFLACLCYETLWFCWDFCNPKSVEFCNMWFFRLYFVSLYFCYISSSLRKFQQIPKLYKVVPTVYIVQNLLIVLASFRSFFINIADIFLKKMVPLECWCRSCFVSAFFLN